jgi:hypothetical protein
LERTLRHFRRADEEEIVIFLARANFLTAALILAIPGAAVATEAADETMRPVAQVVDCRLPPQVRKLGPGSIQQIPGAIVRVSAEECRVRGGSPLDRSRVSAVDPRSR